MNLKDLQKAYKNKKVFITGITGFKGSWLAMLMYYLGADVYGVGLPAEKNMIFDSAHIADIAKIQYCDILSAYGKIMMKKGMENSDYVFHLAAQAVVSEGYRDPYTTFYTNIMGTVIIHDILQNLSSEQPDKKISFINVTTDKVYEEIERPAKEDDYLKGYDPYSLSKSISNMISECYHNIYQTKNSNLKISTVRAGNVIGGGDESLNRIVPDIVRASQMKETLEVRSPHSVRPYQHVLDCLLAYIMIAAKQYENNDYCGAYNVGPINNKVLTTQELVDNMQKFMFFKYKITDKTIGYENPCLILDTSKIIDKIGWKPVYSDTEDLCKVTSEWYKEYFEGKTSMRCITLQQIEKTLKALK